MISGSESGRLRLRIQASVTRGVAEKNRRCWECVDFSVIIAFRLMVLGPILITSGALGTS